MQIDAFFLTSFQEQEDEAQEAGINIEIVAPDIGGKQEADDAGVVEGEAGEIGQAYQNLPPSVERGIQNVVDDAAVVGGRGDRSRKKRDVDCGPSPEGVVSVELCNIFVSKALWYRTFKKLDCSLIWNFYRMYHNIHSSNWSNFMKK